MATTVDFSQHSDRQLLESSRSIRGERYPDNLAACMAEIERRKATGHFHPEDDRFSRPLRLELADTGPLYRFSFKPRPVIVLILTVWFSTWAFIEYALIMSQFGGPPLKSHGRPMGPQEQLIFGIVWSIAGLAVLSAAVWQLFGGDMISIESGGLRHTRFFGRLKFRSRFYPRAEILALELVQVEVRVGRGRRRVANLLRLQRQDGRVADLVLDISSPDARKLIDAYSL